MMLGERNRGWKNKKRQGYKKEREREVGISKHKRERKE